MSEVLREIEDRLSAQGLLETLPLPSLTNTHAHAIMTHMDVSHDQTHVLVDADYCDDVAISGSSPNAFECVQKLHDTTLIVQRIFHSHGMVLNFKPGKSEALIALRGVGKNAVHT